MFFIASDVLWSIIIHVRLIDAVRSIDTLKYLPAGINHSET